MKAVSVEEAVAMIPAGASVMVGGFMGVGTPERLLDELVRQQKSELSLICNDAAIPGKGVGKLFDAALVSRLTATPYRPQSEGAAADAGQRRSPSISCPRAPSSSAFAPAVAASAACSRRPASARSLRKASARSRSTARPFLLETALRAQFALVHAFLADYLGNLAYALTARNFNPVMAMAADTVIVTAENIVPVGVIAPDHVVTPAPLVDYLIANG